MTVELSDNEVDKPLKDELTDPRKNLQAHTVILVLILWVVLTVLGLILPTLTDADATLKDSQGLLMFAIIFSIFHPAGWLNITGFVFALKDQKYRYRWLILSFLAALLSGRLSYWVFEALMSSIVIGAAGFIGAA